MMIRLEFALLFLTGQLAFSRSTFTPTNTATATSTPTATYTPRPTPLPGTYAAAILADGPSAFWPLDEPAGAAVAGDLTGNGHYGTLSAGVTAGAAGPPTGDGGTAMAFHGADAVTVASAAGLPSGAHPYSLEAWVAMAGGGTANEGAGLLAAHSL